MNITLEDQQSVLETFQEYPNGLSLIELSRRSGVNRNKASKIAEDLQRKGILSLYHKSPSKIYTLKKQSSIQVLIDTIAEPVLIINESARVTTINQRYEDHFQTDVINLSGELLHDALKPPYKSLSDSIIQDLSTGTEGQTKTYKLEDGKPLCTTIWITLTDNNPSLIIIFHQDQSQKKNNTEEDVFRKTIYDISQAIPDILKNNSWKSALSETTNIIHSLLPGHLFFTVLIDEQNNTSTLYTCNPPESSPKTKQSEIIQEMKQSRTIEFSNTSILPYKNNQPVYIHTDIQESFEECPVPEIIHQWCRDLDISSLSLMGFCSDNKLEGIIGIGSEDIMHSPVAYAELLHSVSGYLTTIRTFYKKNEDTLDIANGYKKHYSEIYTLLAEKTEEYQHNKDEITELHSILGTILNTLGIMFIGVTKEGILIEVNKSALKTFSIPEMTVLKNPHIDTIFPSDLTKPIKNYLSGQEKGKVFVFDYPHVQTNTTYQWYAVNLKNHSNPDLFLFIGEKNPASLISFLKTHPVDEQVITGIKTSYS